VSRNDGYDIDGIIADIRAGETYRDIANRHGVSRQLVSKLAVHHDLRRRKEYIKRPVHLCACGTKTTAMTGVCVLCRNLDGYPEPADSDGLGEGAWVLDPQRRIRVWQQSEAC